MDQVPVMAFEGGAIVPYYHGGKDEEVQVHQITNWIAVRPEIHFCTMKWDRGGVRAAPRNYCSAPRLLPMYADCPLVHDKEEPEAWLTERSVPAMAERARKAPPS